MPGSRAQSHPPAIPGLAVPVASAPTAQTTTWVPSEIPGSGRLIPDVPPPLDTARALQKLLERNIKALKRYNRPTIVALCKQYNLTFADKATKSALCDFLLATVIDVSPRITSDGAVLIVIT